MSFIDPCVKNSISKISRNNRTECVSAYVYVFVCDHMCVKTRVPLLEYIYKRVFGYITLYIISLRQIFSLNLLLGWKIPATVPTNLYVFKIYNIELQIYIMPQINSSLLGC